MSGKSTQPLKGFEDRYPQDMAFLNYIFDAIKKVARLYGFEQFDGPLVEPLEMYTGKSSAEILETQAFTLLDRNNQKLMLRPEWTPSLARLIAKKSQELVFPVKQFNIGLRYRYEAPQKGRNREFYQMDFDIIGDESDIAEVEILRVVVDILTRLGATQKDFTVRINSRSMMNKALIEMGVPESSYKSVLSCIDKRGKISQVDFEKLLTDTGIMQETISQISDFLGDTTEYEKKFTDLLEKAAAYGIADFIKVDPMIVRGLDYYTGLVFEVTSNGELNRSLLGGGRYDNLVGMFDVPQIVGIGFATSDTILKAFLTDINALPDFTQPAAQVLVTIFDELTLPESIKVSQAIRDAGIGCELYSGNAKLQKQIKYADRRNIQFVVVTGPDEISKSTVMLKNMQTGEQTEIAQDSLITELNNQITKLPSH